MRRRRRTRPSTPLLSTPAPVRWSRGARRGRGKMHEEEEKEEEEVEEEDQAVAHPLDPRRVGAEAAAVGSGLFFTHGGRSISTSPLPRPHTRALHNPTPTPRRRPEAVGGGAGSDR
ncbi:anion exchange protein 3-like [Triticum dicoccoides]|uniref:anion exchange protein 3-like n=1 Tax=Triticum dicoccoides TaxID=85692 RepID=UPI00188F9E0E|nr:anion exchange protein 3-like [Triticum dicoccoides]